MKDDDASGMDIPAPTRTLFGLLADAFDTLEASTAEEIALDIFFEEVDFEGEGSRICVTVNDLVSAYAERDGFIIVATFLSDGADEDDLCPWFRRDSPVAAAEQVVRVLVDAEFLTETDAEIMTAALNSDEGA